MVPVWFMIQKIIITSFVILILLFGIRFLKKITSLRFDSKKEDIDIVDLEKDPKTNEYKPKE
jgi:hypothetical protein